MSSEIPPLSGEILEMEYGLTESQAGAIKAASKDYRMDAIVEHIELSVGNHRSNYDLVEDLLDDIQTEYGLFSVEVVKAYRLCEQRRDYRRMEMIDD